MIKKKCKAHEIIKKNIPKLAAIHEATGYSPFRLVTYFLDYHLDHNEREQIKQISERTAYKYFCKHLREYLHSSISPPSQNLLSEIIRTDYLNAEYFGISFEAAAKSYRQFEDVLKSFVGDAYKNIFPITSDMTPREIAVRNQKIGKVSVKSWIGDILNYAYFKDAPGFMMENVQKSLITVDLFIARLLMSEPLHNLCIKTQLNQKLERELQPKSKSGLKTKITKI